LLISSEGIDKLVLFCTSLVYKTALCDPLKCPSHLFVSFPTFCNYFNTVLIYFRSIVGESTTFSLPDQLLLIPFGLKW
jgi:hypothetical protein